RRSSGNAVLKNWRMTEDGTEYRSDIRMPLSPDGKTLTREEHYTEPGIERIRDWVFATKTLQCRTEMKTADFRGELMPNGQIAVQPEIAAQVPPGEQIQVVLQWGATEDETAWRMAGRQQ